MDTKYKVNIAPRDAAAGAMPDLEVRRPITLLCITLIVLAVAAPLLVTLPQTLDAAASPAPATARASAAPERSYRAEPSVQRAELSVDTADPHEVALWRLRSSD
jgi:hypothetical protein